MFPQLTSCIKNRSSHASNNNNNTQRSYVNAHYNEFSTESGPLWRVQLIDESTMDSANLKFGPELSAILEDGMTDTSTRWRHFLRYHQGNVNQVGIIHHIDSQF